MITNAYTTRGNETESERAIAAAMLGKDQGRKVDYEAVCPVCGAKLWKIIDFGRGPHPVKKICKCKEEENRAAERMAAEKRREEARRKCFQGWSAYTAYTWKNSDPAKNPTPQARKTANVIKRCSTDPAEWIRYKTETRAKSAERKEPQGFILCGPTGTGKTYMAAAACNAVIDAGKSAAFYRVSDLYEQYKTAQRRAEGLAIYWEQLNDVFLMVLDDLGVEAQTKQFEDYLFQLIDHRQTATQNNNCFTIITTNENREKFTNPTESSFERIRSRLASFAVFSVEGEDIRIAGNNDLYSALISGGFMDD